MRNFGGILLLLGVLGFFYASQQVEEIEQRPQTMSADANQELENAADRWQMARFACAGAAGMGLLLALFPKGR